MTFNYYIKRNTTELAIMEMQIKTTEILIRTHWDDYRANKTLVHGQVKDCMASSENSLATPCILSYTFPV